ncbi:MAG: histidine--tRNA ligase [Bacteroidota bacterium]
MAITKPSIPKGTRDFGPLEMARRNYIFNTLTHIFRLHGFLQIETPAMENLSTLLGKYGEEGDKLLFKILNSGDFLGSSGMIDETGNPSQSLSSGSFALKITEKGLRYDLTVPFARFVVQHRNELSFPFKRFQIQPVWRADRPQKGRYREFYQCDVDVIGSNSLLNEVELLQIMDEVFVALGLKVVIKINNRKVLAGMAEVIGQEEKFMAITIAIDKLEKAGLEKVAEELRISDIPEEAIQKLLPILQIQGNNAEKLSQLEILMASSPTGMHGLQEMKTVLDYQQKLGSFQTLEFDLTLARGLNYYTGCIFEVKALDVAMGSICGGGRYDDLTGVFGLPNVSGVGMSFGADRIYDVLNELNLFPDATASGPLLLMVNFGGPEEIFALRIAAELRQLSINTEVFPDSIALKKQFSYADNKHIPFVGLAGTEEIQKGIVNIKNMISGEQWALSREEVLDFFSKKSTSGNNA